MTITATVASAKQIDFIRSLRASRQLTDAEIQTVDAALDPTAAPMTKQFASTVIGNLMSRPAKVAMHDDGQRISEGYYLQTDTVYRVVTAKSTGRIYAKRLVTTAYGRASWDYAPGALRHLAHADRLTIDQAREMGTRYGVCVVCGATLTDPDSVERGIGPVCAAKL